MTTTADRVCIVDTARHRSYVDARAFRKELDRVAGVVGWPMRPGMFAGLRRD